MKREIRRNQRTTENNFVHYRMGRNHILFSFIFCKTSGDAILYLSFRNISVVLSLDCAYFRNGFCLSEFLFDQNTI